MSLMKLSLTHTHLWVAGSFLIYGAIKSLWSTAYGWQFAFHLMTMKSGVWKILQWSTCFSTPSLVIFNHTSWLPTSASPQGLGKKTVSCENSQHLKLQPLLYLDPVILAPSVSSLLYFLRGFTVYWHLTLNKDLLHALIHSSFTTSSC